MVLYSNISRSNTQLQHSPKDHNVPLTHGTHTLPVSCNCDQLNTQTTLTTDLKWYQLHWGHQLEEETGCSGWVTAEVWMTEGMGGRSAGGGGCLAYKEGCGTPLDEELIWSCSSDSSGIGGMEPRNHRLLMMQRR